MPTTKVAVTIEAELLREVDRWVAGGEFPSRSRAIQEGLLRLREQRAKQHSLVAELAKLDPAEERALAEEELVGEGVSRKTRGSRSRRSARCQPSAQGIGLASSATVTPSRSSTGSCSSLAEACLSPATTIRAGFGNHVHAQQEAA